MLLQYQCFKSQSIGIVQKHFKHFFKQVYLTLTGTISSFQSVVASHGNTIHGSTFPRTRVFQPDAVYSHTPDRLYQEQDINKKEY